MPVLATKRLPSFWQDAWHLYSAWACAKRPHGNLWSQYKKGSPLVASKVVGFGVWGFRV